MAKCFIPTEEPRQGAVTPGGATHCCQSREEKERKTGWHFSTKGMKKKSLLSVMGTHPDPDQVALEVSEAGPERGGVNSERLRAM